MAKPLSTDRRDRLRAAVDAGAARQAVAERYDVVSSTVTKLIARARATGSTAPAGTGGDRRSGAIEARHGRRFAPSVIGRLLDRHGNTLKKMRARMVARALANVVSRPCRTVTGRRSPSSAG